MKQVVLPASETGQAGWRVGENPREIIEARRPQEVLPALAAVEWAAKAGSREAVTEQPASARP